MLQTLLVSNTHTRYWNKSTHYTVEYHNNSILSWMFTISAFHRCVYMFTTVHLNSEPCVEGSVRLYIGDDDLAFLHGEFDELYYYNKDRLTRGRVEYCSNETYHGICGDEWNYIHASVVCKQLGFSRHGM